MIYSTFNDLVLKLLNKYSARGTELNPTKTADIRLKIQDFINAELMDLASTTGKLPAKKSYVQKPVCNGLSYDTSSIKQHLPGLDFVVTLVGAKAYFFEAVGPATVTIDESVGGVWTNLETITILDTVTEMTEYKKLITASDVTNPVRMNFSGSYVYSFQNYILYPYAFPADASVQQHRPRFIYALPIDYLKMNSLTVRRDSRQEVEDKTYILDLTGKTMSLNRYVEGEYILNYWRKPIDIIITDVDATDDAQTVDANADGIYVMALGVASLVTAKNDPATAVLLNNLYEAKKANLTSSDGVYVQSQVPLSGW
jgi:hypothetical protein